MALERVPVPWWYAVFCIFSVDVSMMVFGSDPRPFQVSTELFIVVLLLGILAGPIAYWNESRSEYAE